MKPHPSQKPKDGSIDSSLPLPKDGKGVQMTIPSQKKLGLTLNLEIDSEVMVTINQLGADGIWKAQQIRKYSNHPTLFHKILTAIRSRTIQWSVIWIFIALLVYLASRLIGLDRFPIYFFSDEAIQTVQAENLIHDHFNGEGKEFLPTFVQNGNQYNLGLSVYLQVIPSLIFENSIWVTRGVSILISLLAAISVGLISKNILNSRQPYLVILLLSITPAWFLHSRTAFETVLAVSFYAAFVYCYLMYRQGKKTYLYAAVVFAALSFYSYSPAQMVIGVTGVGLFFSDLRFHWKNRKTLLFGLIIGVVLAIPYFRFLINHPAENLEHLRILNSYLVKSIPAWQKAVIYFQQYWQSFNPFYWFFPNQLDLVRHVMKGYGNLAWWSLPLVFIGVAKLLGNLKQSSSRAILIVLLASPSGAALAGPGITRSLFMVIPAALIASLGLDQVITWITKIKVKNSMIAALIMATFIGVNGYMVWDVLQNAPTWYQDYGMGGMQYGSQQLFSEVKQYLKQNPKDKLLISSQWANGADTLAQFFLGPPVNYQLGSIEMWLNDKLPLDENNVFVVIPEEMVLVQDNPKFKSLEVIKTLYYPNGQSGFYFVKAAYADNIDLILANEKAARRQLNPGKVTLPDGTDVEIKYSTLDMGTIQDAFDNDQLTVIRSLEANPLILQLAFEDPYPLSEISLSIGGNPTTMEIQITPANGEEDILFHKVVPVSNDYRNISFSLKTEELVKEIKISVKNSDDLEPSHVHLWEVSLK